MNGDEDWGHLVHVLREGESLQITHPLGPITATLVSTAVFVELKVLVPLDLDVDPIDTPTDIVTLDKGDEAEICNLEDGVDVRLWVHDYRTDRASIGIAAPKSMQIKKLKNAS